MNRFIRNLERPADWKRFVEPWWIEQCKRIEAVLREEKLQDDFLHYHDMYHKSSNNLFAEFGIINWFYFHWREDYAELAKNVDIATMADPPWGGLANWWDIEREPCPQELPFSPTLINQGASLSRNLKVNKINPPDLKSVVHWGAGCGIQTYLMRQWGATHTEYIIDLPVQSAVQHQFLGQNLGWDQVHMADTEVVEGKINTVPLSRIHLVPQGHDLFIALHSLNESTEYAQDYVKDERNWFDADKLLLEWTDGHSYFDGSTHWLEIVKELQDEGRVLPTSEFRVPNSKNAWEANLPLLPEIYKERFGQPVLYLPRETWINVGDADHPGSPVRGDLEGWLSEGTPIIIIDVAHVPWRADYQWVLDAAKGHGYGIDQRAEVLILFRNDLIGPLNVDELTYNPNA